MNNSVNFDKWICSLAIYHCQIKIWNISLTRKFFCVLSDSYSLQRQLFFWFLTLQISSAFSELSIHVIIEHVLSVSDFFHSADNFEMCPCCSVFTSQFVCLFIHPSMDFWVVFSLRCKQIHSSCYEYSCIILLGG